MHRLSDFSLLRGIALRWMKVLSSTGFSLCSAEWPQLKPHRLMVRSSHHKSLCYWTAPEH